VEQKLLEAGLRGPGPIAMFYLFRFATPVILLMLALIYVLVAGEDMKVMSKLMIVMGAIVVGFYLPNFVVGIQAGDRRKSIMRAFPDALDLLLICVESGMSIESAFLRVGAEIGTSSIPLAEELGLTNAELSYLQDRRVAYENLAKRTNHPGVKGVATALIQAERYGTPLGSALRVMSKENRELRMTEAEKKAAALPAKLTVPMIVFFLPVLFIVILTPAYIQWQNMNGGAGPQPIIKPDSKDQ
jgi:tight adherence protein C